MKEWIINNKEWFFSGLGVTILGGIFGILRLIFKRRDNTNSSTNNQNQHQTVNVYNGVTDNTEKSKSMNKSEPKRTIHILFIDDEKFNMIQILKTMGWLNIEYRKNVVNPDDDVVLRSDVIFVDINGVGGGAYRNQGIGLAAAIKQKHPEKKVVIYSAETTGDRFDEDLRKIDKCLPKNAEPIQFSNMIEDLCR